MFTDREREGIHQAIDAMIERAARRRLGSSSNGSRLLVHRSEAAPIVKPSEIGPWVSEFFGERAP